MRPITILLYGLLGTGIALAEDPDFSSGVFMVNEDWYGHQNSTINYFDHNAPDGDVWQYRVIQTQNPGKELGCTNQYGQIYGDRFYLVAKQEKDPGASIKGGRITVADAKTMKVLFQSDLIDPSGTQCDGRGCLGVDTGKVYISTSNGVWILDTETYEVTGQVEGSANPNGTDGKPNTDPTGSLYHGQCGSMVRVNDRVFVAHQAFGLLVVDPATDKVTDIVTMQLANEAAFADGYFPSEITDLAKGAGIGSVVLARDGSLWASVAMNIQGTGATLPYLLKIDPATLDAELVRLPVKGCFPPANSWYAWTPDGFHASYTENVLFWNGGPNSWFTSSRVFRYDIYSGKVTKIIDLDAEAEEQGLDKYTKWQIYGCSMRSHPVSGDMYLSLYHYFQNPTYKLRRSDPLGAILGEYDMIQNYWFPSLPVFPDNLYPEVSPLPRQTVSGSEPSLINLDGWATDGDNLDAAIVKTVTEVSDAGMFSARMDNGNLLVTPRPGASGDAWVKIDVNSNGHVTPAVIDLAFTSSGIGLLDAEKPFSARYVNGIMTLTGTSSSLPFSVCDTAGRVIARGETCTGETQIPLPLAPGLYLVTHGNHTVKIIVKGE